MRVPSVAHCLLHCVVLVWLLGDVSKLATLGRGCRVCRMLYTLCACQLVCVVSVVRDGRSGWVDGAVGCFKVVVCYGGPNGASGRTGGVVCCNVGAVCFGGVLVE